MFSTKTFTAVAVAVICSFGDARPQDVLSPAPTGDLVFTSTVDYAVPDVPKPSVNDTSLPRKYGMVLFPGFEPLDVFGPTDVIYTLSRTYYQNLSLIAKTMDPVSNAPQTQMANPQGSWVFPHINPTHTFETAPKDLDVLIVPGGGGTRAPDEQLKEVYDYIRETYPKVKYLITVCTGAMLAAKAGVLDGKNATTNKLAWKTVTESRPQVNWVPHARWVKDGNIWTGAGVSAGIDTTSAFVAEHFGMAVAKKTTNDMEYKWDPNPALDPFSAVNGLPANPE